MPGNVICKVGTRQACFGSVLWLGMAASQGTAVAAASAEEAWPVVGRQGMVQLVIVPVSAARDRDSYVQQIKRLCQPEQTCFLNFYTNSTGAELALPLPDAVSHEATAVFRRSTKQGAEMFRWSCRMGSDEGNCF